MKEGMRKPQGSWIGSPLSTAPPAKLVSMSPTPVTHQHCRS